MDDSSRPDTADPYDEIGDAQRRHALFAALFALGLTNPAGAQDAAAVQPRAYRVALDNEHVRVLDFYSKPGMGVCGVGMHSHPAHLTVALTAAKVRVKNADGTTMQAESKAGDVFWSPAETHEVENISGKDSRALIVELKSLPPAKS